MVQLHFELLARLHDVPSEVELGLEHSVHLMCSVHILHEPGEANSRQRGLVNGKLKLMTGRMQQGSGGGGREKQKSQQGMETCMGGWHFVHL